MHSFFLVDLPQQAIKTGEHNNTIMYVVKYMSISAIITNKYQIENETNIFIEYNQHH